MAFEMKYEVGQRVYLLEPFEINEQDEDDESAFTDMDGLSKYAGQFATILRLDDEDKSYRIKYGDGHESWWAEDWLRPVVIVSSRPVNSSYFADDKGTRYFACSHAGCVGADIPDAGLHHSNHPFFVEVVEKEPQAPHLQVGQQVRVKSADQLGHPVDGAHSGKVLTIMEIDECPYYGSPQTVRLAGLQCWPGSYPIGSNDVELIDEAAKESPVADISAALHKAKEAMKAELFAEFNANPTFNNHNDNKEETHMSSATNLVNAKLSADERYARQNSLKNADGTITRYGLEVLNQFLWDANEKAIVKALKDADKALRAAAKADTDELGNVIAE